MSELQDLNISDRRRDRPLVVDMDGSLLATDALWESVILLLKNRPLSALLIPIWTLRGREVLKSELARRILPDPSILPYNEDVLAFLREEHGRDRRLVLATASNKAIAERVAAHLQIFSAVLGSDDHVNLRGDEKLKAVQSLVGPGQQFDYIGNAATDLVLWKEANLSYLVRPSRSLEAVARSTCNVDRVFGENDRGVLSLIAGTGRIHQWSKNLLLFVPLLLAHRIADVAAIGQVTLAFLSFSLCASAVYVLNDLVDLPHDRVHPDKKARPLAAGTLSIQTALILAIVSVTIGLGGAILLLPVSFVTVLLIYLLTTTAYSLFLKQLLVVDVIVLASLYALRVVAGGVVAGVEISQWLIALSVFFFLSLALLKRYSEIILVEELARDSTEGRGYLVDDRMLILTFGTTSGLLSVLVFALYITSNEVIHLYAHPEILWLVGPSLLYWIMRMWLLAHRGELREDPIIFTFKDRASYAVGVLVAALAIAAAL